MIAHERGGFSRHAEALRLADIGDWIVQRKRIVEMFMNQVPPLVDVKAPLCFAFEAGVCGAMGQRYLSASWGARPGLPARHRRGEMHAVRAVFFNRAFSDRTLRAPTHTATRRPDP